MSFQHAVRLARLWRDAGGRAEVEFGALEPLLWREGAKRLADLVRGVRNEGLVVTITTNGSLLREHAIDLRAARVDLVRVSWHTTNPTRFRDISGTGDYASFREGVKHAAGVGLPLS